MGRSEDPGLLVQALLPHLPPVIPHPMPDFKPTGPSPCPVSIVQKIFSRIHICVGLPVLKDPGQIEYLDCMLRLASPALWVAVPSSWAFGESLEDVGG